ncbi:MAG: VOC family protein [Ignavibacteriales bacterium]|nr:VOC family protein [Ignavibacteriales bacterium]
MTNSLNWFEIPAIDINRAEKFYAQILSVKMQLMDFGGLKMSTFPMDSGGVSGALCQGAPYKPSQDGALIYLNANPDLSVALSKVEEAGGKVLMPKKQISEEYGFMALIIDSEGNRIALHSNK